MRLRTVAFILLFANASQVTAQQSPAAWMGVRLAFVSDEAVAELELDSNRGVLVVDVIPKTPAQAAGFRANDVIRRMDQTVIDDWDDLRDKMRASKPGQVMKITVIRETKKLELTITLGQRPDQVPQEEVPH